MGIGLDIKLRLFHQQATSREFVAMKTLDAIEAEPMAQLDLVNKRNHLLIANLPFYLDLCLPR